MSPPTTAGHALKSGMFDKIVEIKVGESQKPFMLHEGILRHYSGYFDAALGGNFAEARSRIIKLKEEEVETFQRFVLWLYTGRYERNERADENFDPICQLWTFADRRQIPLLANTMIDNLREEIIKGWTVPTRSMGYIYSNTTPSSKLREFVIWVISSTCSQGVAREHWRESWPVDAMFDTLKAVWALKDRGAKLIGKEELARKDMCVFHQHGEGEKCVVSST